MNIEIVPATDKDATILANILSEATEFKLSHGDKTWGDEPYSEDEVIHYMKKNNIYIVRLNKEPIGSFSLQWEDTRMWGEKPPDTAYLHQLALKNSFHGKGLGKQLIKNAEEESIKNNKKILRLDCEEKNFRLCSYYEKNGFTKVGSKKVDSDMGEYVAALFEKKLDTN
jgi:ribosomal protein S18 acetylase RimI-like enzyme